MHGETTQSGLGQATVMMTSGRGLNPDELTELALNKIIFVSADAPAALREQALAYKAKLRGLLYFYLAQAQKSQNTTIYTVLLEAGETSAAELVRSL